MWRTVAVVTALGAIVAIGGCAGKDGMSGNGSMQDHSMSGSGSMPDHGMSGQSGMDSGSMMKDGGATYTK